MYWGAIFGIKTISKGQLENLIKHMGKEKMIPRQMTLGEFICNTMDVVALGKPVPNTMVVVEPKA